jgi:hypothetical protein
MIGERCSNCKLGQVSAHILMHTVKMYHYHCLQEEAAFSLHQSLYHQPELGFNSFNRPQLTYTWTGHPPPTSAEMGMGPTTQTHVS